jgi:hypothetical protein
MTAQLEAEIERLKMKCDKQAMMLRRIFPDRYAGVFFICARVGKKTAMACPKGYTFAPHTAAGGRLSTFAMRKNTEPTPSR